MTASHDDLQRSLGRVEGNQDAMEARMDRFEKLVSEGFDKVEGTLKAIDARLQAIETRENIRKGAWATIVAVATLVAGFLGALFEKWMH